MPIRKNPSDIPNKTKKGTEKDTLKIPSKKVIESKDSTKQLEPVENKKTNKGGFKKCLYCGKEIDKRAIKCQYCKKFLTKDKIECPFCFNKIDFDSEKCPFCEEFIGDLNNADNISENRSSLINLNKNLDINTEKEIDDENDEDYERENEGEDDYNERDGENRSKDYRCSSCKGDVDEDDEVCPHCGKIFDEDENNDEDTSLTQIILILFFLVVIGGAVISYFSN